MIKQITREAYEFWISVSCLLLAIETLIANGYLLWSGIAAIIVGIIVWLIPLSLEIQVFIFLISTIISVLFWWYWLNKICKPQKGLPNQRNQNMIGLRVILIEPTNNGYSRVKINDSSWRTYCEMELIIGTKVEIISINGNTLNVKPIV
ncbi:NfeD family protein [Arsenophonus endosymbiont of Lipoptena cervi]|uniref:NfeD family protein n=1 Tax=Arsenophonus endosymbiont of Lipoptena cervi TaxID=363258 RepID=UPI00376F1A7C